LFFAMLGVVLLGFLLTGAATLVGFARLDQEYNAARLIRKEEAMARSLRFALESGVGDTVEATSLSWTVMPGAFADRIVEIEEVHGLPLAVYRLDGSLFVTSSVAHPDTSGFVIDADPEVLISLAQGAGRLEVPIGGGEYLAYWYQTNSDGRPVALVALRYASRSLETGGIRDFLWSLGGVFGLVFFVAAGFAFLLTRSIAQPLSRLGALMERMDVSKDEGFEPLKYAAGAGDEIAVLVERYNRMAENVRRSAAALARSERESAWREMAMQVAHEIKNPLTPMKLGIQQLERRAKDDGVDRVALKDQVVALSAVLQGQIDLLTRIADEFSTLARLPQGELLPCSLRAILEQVVELYVDHGVRPVLTMEGDVEVLCDEDQLVRMFHNLVLNAQQAIGDDGGTIGIAVHKDPVRVIVRDTGPGIPPEILSRIFEPQFTTRGSGSGLGLAIVKAIADYHKVAVACDSEPGNGASFTLVFPS
jgi:signal transduction histidine kinase